MNIREGIENISTCNKFNITEIGCSLKTKLQPIFFNQEK